MIAAYYRLRYATVELFAASAAEASRVPQLLEALARHARHKPPRGCGPPGRDAAAKAHALLQSHFSRRPVASADLRADRDAAVEASVALLQALVDVVSSNGWLAPALHAMELSQMVVQGLWHD